MPTRFLYLTAVLASILSLPLNITVAYLSYKFLVFRTKGNYIREWLKCFTVYGTGMNPGLVRLSALTRLLQTLIHSHATSLHTHLNAVERHLAGRPLLLMQHITTGNAMAGYMAGAILIATSTIYTFLSRHASTRKPTSSTCTTRSAKSWPKSAATIRAHLHRQPLHRLHRPDPQAHRRRRHQRQAHRQRAQLRPHPLAHPRALPGSRRRDDRHRLGLPGAARPDPPDDRGMGAGLPHGSLRQALQRRKSA